MTAILTKYWVAFLGGAVTTLQVSALSWAIGIVGGFTVGLLAARSGPAGRGLTLFAFVIGAIPALVVLFWFHYPAQSLLGVVIDPFFTTVFVLSVINIALVADIVRFSASQMAREYLEAAFIHGWSRSDAVRSIEVPLIIRASAGRILFVQVTILHMTLFASLISLDELFRVAQRVNSIEFKPVEIYSLIAFFYFALSAPILITSEWLQRRFGRDFSER